MSNKIQGVDASKDIGLELEKDLTPTVTKLKHFFKNEGIWIFLIFFNLIPIILSGANFLFEPIFFLSLLLAKYNINNQETLPYKKRKTSIDNYDLNEIHPGHGKPDVPQGITFFGNEIGTKKEIWFTDSDVRTHCLIFGTTGAGKTETLLSICVNTLNQSSGFIYIDGKGDNSLWAKIFSLVAARARLDDLYLINYMTASVNLDKKSTEKISNTMNPLATGNADSLTELIVSLLPGSGGGDMWKGRASVFIGALFKSLVYLRDQGKILLDIDATRKYFTLQKIIELSLREDIPIKYRDGLVQYVINLPGYVEPTPSNPTPEQADSVAEQHGYITMQFTETFGLLSDTYGHIMKTQVAEVDFYDIVVNRRILVVLLPALEKSTQNLGNLGRIIIASIKNMMSTTLGSAVEGDREKVIDTKPTNAASPYLTIFDEYGYYSVEGAAVMPAQARSLGFFMIFAGQDFQAFQKGSKEEAFSIVANCAIKICMKLEDAADTLKIFQDSAGEGDYAAVQSMEKKEGTTKFDVARSVNIQKKRIIDVRDLRNQNAGEAHILFKDTTRRMKCFYAAPTPLSCMRVNSFLEIEPPSFDVVKELKTGNIQILRKYNEVIKNPKAYSNTVKKAIDVLGSEELSTIVKFMNYAKGLPNENLKGVFSIASYLEKINMVDNEIVTEIRNNVTAFSENNELDKTTVSKPITTKPKVVNTNTKDKFDDDLDQIDDDIQNSEIAIKQRLNKEIESKQNFLDTIENDTTISIFEKMGMDFLEIKEEFKELEVEVTNKMNEKGLVNNKAKIDKASLLAENTILDAATAAIPIKPEELNNKVERDDEINDLINSIIGDEIDSL
jgi:intracellular multiplication protein IcmO